MPGLARTLALKAQKSQTGVQQLAADSFLQVNSRFITGPEFSKPRGPKKRKIKESSPDEILSNEHDTSTPSASVPPSLLLEATPFGSLLDGYADHLSELSQPEAKTQSRTFSVATSGTWEVLLPKLVYPLME